MDKVFLQLLNMSLTGGIVILFIMLVRLLLKRAPKVFSYALWSVALFRLLCPFSFESVVSLLPVKSQSVPMDIALSPSPRIDSGFAPLDAAVNSFLPAPKPGDSVNPLQAFLFIGEILWLAGAAALLLGSAISYIRLRLRLKGAVLAEKGVYEVPGLETPFLLGVFRPKIYLPAGLSGEERQYVLCHERTHLKRLDHLVKPLGYFALCLHWFNPLVWAAFFLMETDMELSCDESVLKQMGNGAKKGYSSSLLSMSAKGRVFGGSPLAFGEIRIKARVKNVLRYKKPAFWALLTAIIVVAGTLLGLAGSPREKPKMDPDKLATGFASLWKEKLWPEELAKAPGARPNGVGFLEDLNGDGIPELFFLYDLGETAQGLVYRLDDGSFTQLARFASTGFQDPRRPIDLVFDLYHGEGVTVFRSSQTLYASSGSPQMQSIVDQFLIWKNGILTSKTMERMKSADGSQDTYFNPNPSDGRLEIPFEEFLAYRQSLLAGTSDTVEQLTVPGSYLVRDFLEGDALENHLRAILTQWKGQATATHVLPRRRIQGKGSLPRIPAHPPLFPWSPRAWLSRITLALPWSFPPPPIGNSGKRGRASGCTATACPLARSVGAGLTSTWVCRRSASPIWCTQPSAWAPLSTGRITRRWQRPAIPPRLRLLNTPPRFWRTKARLPPEWRSGRGS